MSFPLSIEGEIRLNGSGEFLVEPFLASVEQGLRDARVSTVERDGQGVCFTVNLMRLVSNWNLLAVIDRGCVNVVQGEPQIVHFDFSCRRLLVIATLGVLWLASMPLQDGAYGFAAFVAVFGWLWLFGVNYSIAAIRLIWFIKRHVRQHAAAA